MTGGTLDARILVERRGFRLDAEVSARAGETVAIMGPSGAGKSTLLAAIAGLLRMPGGHVLIDGRDVAGSRPAPPQRRGIVLLGQDPHLFPHLSAVENVAFGLRAHGADRGTARREAGAWLRRVGLDGLDRRRPAELSGGQQQRVALARALATSPRLLLLDEPLTALDPETAGDIRGLLGRQLSDARATALIVTHDAVDAASLAHRLVVIEAGAVSQEGPVRDVLATPATRFAAAVAGTNRLLGIAEGGRWASGRDGRATLIAEDAASRTAASLDGAPLAALVRPGAVALEPVDGTGGASDAAPRPGEWLASVVRLEHTPAGARVHTAEPPVAVDVPADAVAAWGLAPGVPVRLRVAPGDVRFTPAEREPDKPGGSPDRRE